MKPISNEDFDRILRDIVDEQPASHLLSINGVYEGVSAEYNNAVLDRWRDEQPAEDDDEDDGPLKRFDIKFDDGRLICGLPLDQAHTYTDEPEAEAELADLGLFEEYTAPGMTFRRTA